MSSRVFQSIVLQMKECTDRVIGVIDDQGTVVSCNQLTWIGEKWEGAASALNVNESAVVIYGDKTFKPLVSRGSHFDYAAFVQGSDEQAKLICSMVTVALNSAKAYYEEKHDKTAFVKSIISDNILLGDIYVRAKELHFASEAQRAVFLVRQVGSAEIAAVDVVQSLFSDNPDDFVISINETDIAVIKTLTDGGDGKEIYRIAKSIEDALAQNLKLKTTIGIGTVVSHIRDLARAYKEAGVAIDVGKVFDTEKTIITYENLGIGRLIYQLPTVMCDMFLQEVFKKNPIDALDQETLFTINKWMFLWATVLIWPFTISHVMSIDFAQVPMSTWWETGYVVLFGTYLGYICMMIGQKTLRPTVVSVYNYVQPLVSVTVSVIVGLAVFKGMQAIAAILVFSGVWLVVKSKSKRDIDQHDHSLAYEKRHA